MCGSIDRTFPVSEPPTLDKDVQDLIGKGVPVYAVDEDLASRGIDKSRLVQGVQVVGRGEVAKLWDSHDDIWHW